MAILVCLDVEMPALSSLLARQDLDLLLVPSMTEKPSGYHRVFGCAKARAVELMCAVGVCGVVGASKGTTQNDTNFSGAALYLPCEEEFGYSGVAAEIPLTGGTSGDEPFLVSSVPVEELRALKSGKAEVWPGGHGPRITSRFPRVDLPKDGPDARAEMRTKCTLFDGLRCENPYIQRIPIVQVWKWDLAKSITAQDFFRGCRG
ncbi:hypothetical protein QW131_07430 [Roseibium salinum]|nr:hypothetical protein [Roseibium salinum]